MEKEAKEFFKNYTDFVDEVTSSESKDFDSLIKRLHELNDRGIDVPRFLTAGIGIAAEGGEFNEIIKKMIFQGKPVNDENLLHLKKELGDIQWYWIQACKSLNLDPVDVIDTNVKKLESRYPDGKFDVFFSENRKAGDL